MGSSTLCLTTTSALLIVTLTLLLIPGALSAETNYPNYEVPVLGEDVVLRCNDTSIPNDTVPIFWVTPDVTPMLPDTTQGNRRVSADAMEVHVSGVTISDIGYWYCGLRTLNDTTYMQRIGLNANGPYFEDLWAKYRRNTITALSVAAAFGVLAASLMLTYQFRWEARVADRKVNGMGTQYDYEDDINGKTASVELGPMPAKVNNHNNDTTMAIVAMNGSAAVTTAQVAPLPEKEEDTVVETPVTDITPVSNGQPPEAAAAIATEEQGQVNQAFVAEAPPPYNGVQKQEQPAEPAPKTTDAVVHL